MLVQDVLDDKLDADVDLWVEAPGDRPVGYSNKSGQIFSLLRDDLGKSQDITDFNYEIAYSRGMPAGGMTPARIFRTTPSHVFASALTFPRLRVSNATGTVPRCFCGWLWQPRQFRLRNADGASRVCCPAARIKGSRPGVGPVKHLCS
jgi:hypothetical protein